MDVSIIGAGTAAVSPSGSSLGNNLRDANTAARQLNDLGVADREFSVIRDPQSQRFVVVVVESSTGSVLDQFPAENVLRMLSQMAANQAAAPAMAAGAGAGQSYSPDQTTNEWA